MIPTLFTLRKLYHGGTEVTEEGLFQGPFGNGSPP
jgi:hypothetical protein